MMVIITIGMIAFVPNYYVAYNKALPLLQLHAHHHSLQSAFNISSAYLIPAADVTPGA